MDIEERPSNLAESFMSCVTLGQIINFFAFQFSYLLKSMVIFLSKGLHEILNVEVVSSESLY
jgi:hypothetical protein